MASFFDKYLTPISVGFPPVGLKVVILTKRSIVPYNFCYMAYFRSQLKNSYLQTGLPASSVL